MSEILNRAVKTIYCHFSFKRPTNKPYGLFSVAFYTDFEGKKLITYVVRKIDLWENQQFITAIQSYENALQIIYEFQGQMRNNGINQVMLVTDNSTLAGWISNPKKNKQYAPYMDRAVKAFRTGSYKEIVIGIGLCEPRNAEKSYKYCKEEYVTGEYIPTKTNDTAKASGYKINIGDTYRSISDILQEDKSIPEISGIKDVE